MKKIIDCKINKKIILGLVLEGIFMLLYLMFDLLTKKYIYGNIKNTNQEIIIIKNVIRFTAVENTGASFGIFGNSTLALTIISFISIFILFATIIGTARDRNPILRSALVLIFAGGLGNLIDRVKFGYVRDFVYFELIKFPVFNFADSALTIGCVLAIIWIIFVFSKSGNKSKNDTSVVASNNDNEDVIINKPNDETIDDSSTISAEMNEQNDFNNSVETKTDEPKCSDTVNKSNDDKDI